jgi:hypothetical protein
MMVFWPEIKKLAYSVLNSEIRDWEYVDAHFFKKSEWTINISNIFKFQDNLYGQESSEFKTMLMNELFLLAISCGYEIIHENENELVLGK